MSGWSRHEGRAVAPPLEGVDTDQLIPARFMSAPRSKGYGRFLLHDQRRGEDGAPDPAFPLEAEPDATILIARRKFGSGSSREAAVYALLVAFLATPAAAEDVLSAVHAFPETLIYTQSFLDFVDAVNARGEGVVRIDVRGGPEAIGMMQQPDAVRNGVVDMVYTPGSFYAGTVPEKDALVASDITAAEARENGGIALIDQIHQEKMGVKYLGWFDSGVAYNLWTVNEPALDEEGNLDVSGIRLRGNAVYNAFFNDYLGAQVIDLPTGDVYAALERGVVDATGWTQIGLADLRWDEFLDWRIEPAFFSTDLGVIVNLDAWEGLTEESRTILQEEAIRHERESAERLGAMRDEQFAALSDGGMQVVELQGEAARAYLEAARSTTHDRMRRLMEEQGGAENYDRLVELFSAEGE